MSRCRFRFLLAAGEATPGSQLAPPLATFGLDLSRLVREINDRSLVRFSRGMPITVRLVVTVPRQWTISFDPTPFALCCSSVGMELTRAKLYGILLLLSIERQLPAKLLAPSLFGSLRSYGALFRFLKD